MSTFTKSGQEVLGEERGADGGVSYTQGGLLLPANRKTPTDGSEVAPRASVLGLDRLAREKEAADHLRLTEQQQASKLEQASSLTGAGSEKRKPSSALAPSPTTAATEDIRFKRPRFSHQRRRGESSAAAAASSSSSAVLSSTRSDSQRRSRWDSREPRSSSPSSSSAPDSRSDDRGRSSSSHRSSSSSRESRFDDRRSSSSSRGDRTYSPPSRSRSSSSSSSSASSRASAAHPSPSSSSSSSSSSFSSTISPSSPSSSAAYPSQGYRAYRRSQPETPSNPGGVNHAVRERLSRQQLEQKHHRARGPGAHPTHGAGASSSSSASQRSSQWEQPETTETGPIVPTHRRRGGVLVEETPEALRRNLLDSMRRRSPSSPRPPSVSGRRAQHSHGRGAEETEDRERNFDRRFYDEDADAVPGTEQDAFLGDEKKWEQFEADLARKQVKKLTARQNQVNEDNRRWEENRLLQSGVAVRRTVQTEFDDEEENRVHLLVHEVKPPFLDGRQAFTKQADPVPVVRDPTSDLAVVARKGSHALMRLRQEKDKHRSRDRFWDLAGSKIGNMMGVADPKGDQERSAKAERAAQAASSAGGGGNEDEDAGLDFKADSQYAKHMDQKSEAASAFSRDKTLAQQRETLPIFQVKRPLMQVLRDNQIVVLVGETGSGKTT
eukprot:CAMPEP_0174249166 /NCGR_PEP_ID=MMETSP0417-20130205/43443_1 /TAXON_ID=242541 /ORGANISM="Mayorella sp, Strain BSH-02190019" /LENGTH=664 /DNA_ID=CAMNT_0015329035 /DNA_START=83 /DNA_END=2073 /DNA_ORIENTATION=+